MQTNEMKTLVQEVYEAAVTCGEPVYCFSDRYREEWPESSAFDPLAVQSAFAAGNAKAMSAFVANLYDTPDSDIYVEGDQTPQDWRNEQAANYMKDLQEVNEANAEWVKNRIASAKNGCEATHLLTVETDDDFGVSLYGQKFTGHTFSIRIAPENLDDLVVLGPWGSEATSSTKRHEFDEGIAAIKANPSEDFDSTGGNRGVMWHQLAN